MTKFYENYKIYLGIALLIGIAMRFYGLSIQSLWLDELYTTDVSSHGFSYFWTTLISDTHPPLYQLFMYSWFKIFGMSEVTARLPSAIAGSLSLFALYYFAKRAFNSYVAASATIILALTFAGVAYSQEARDYSVLMLFSIVSTFSLIKLVNTNQPKSSNYIIYAIASIIVAYIHYFGLILIGFQFIYLFLVTLYSNKNELTKVIVTEVSLVIAYIPWITIMASAVKTVNSGTFWIPKIQFAYIKEYLKFIFYPDTILLLVSIGLLFIVPYLIDDKKFTNNLMSLLRSAKITSPSFILSYLVISVITLTTIVSIVSQPILIPRYIIFLAPFIYILGASWMSMSSRIVGWKQVAYTFTICMICMSFLAMVYYQPQKEQWREATQEAVSLTNNQTLLVTMADYLSPSYGYYLNKSHVPVGTIIVNMPKDNVKDIVSQMNSLDKNRLVFLGGHYENLTQEDQNYLQGISKVHKNTSYVGANTYMYQF